MLAFPATQKEALPSGIEGNIRRLGQELSCSICLSVYDDPVVTPCNHIFCRYLGGLYLH